MVLVKEFPNGIRLVHEITNSNISHCAIILNIGSRDENNYEKGSAHFLEHLFFKGTKKRKSYHILSFLDNVGGELNAYTTKEKIIIHASFLKEYFNRAVDLIYDMVFNSTFPEKEIEKEKTVIIDEINSYKDSPSELIIDEIEEIIFDNSFLGNSILGSPDSINNINQRSLNKFFNENISTNEIVFTSSGNISDKELSNIYNKYFANIPFNDRKNKREKSILVESKFIEKKLNTNQAHIVLACPSYSLYDERILVVHLINTYLAGVSMSSVLNLKLREKYGIAYNIESFLSSYSDNGIFGLYLGTDKKNIKKSLSVVFREIDNLRKNLIGSFKLSKIKKQFIGQISFSKENNLGHSIFLGKYLLDFNKIEDWNNTIKRIENITSSSILETANNFLKEQNISTLIYK